MHFPFRNLYLGKMPTKLGKNGQFWGGEMAEIWPQNGPKKITGVVLPVHGYFFEVQLVCTAVQEAEYW
jgi:hypothetical protein